MTFKEIADHKFVPSRVLGRQRCTICAECKENHAGFLGRLWWRIGGWNFWGGEQ